MACLECRHLYKSFGGHQVLRGVSLTFPQQGTVAVIGPNGAGKTTLLNALSGFVSLESGEILLEGANLSHLHAYQRARLGMFRTFQELRLIHRLTVIEHLLLAASVGRQEFLFSGFSVRTPMKERQERQRCLEVLASIELERLAHEYVGALSYGQRKILSVALAVVAKARILLLDEPVSGVHPTTVAAITSLLRRLATENRLIIFVEHDFAMVRAAADHIYVMDGGEILTEGEPKAVLASQQVLNAYVG